MGGPKKTIFGKNTSMGGLNRSEFNQESIAGIGFSLDKYEKVIANFHFWPDYGVILEGKMSHLKIG